MKIFHVIIFSILCCLLSNANAATFCFTVTFSTSACDLNGQNCTSGSGAQTKCDYVPDNTDIVNVQLPSNNLGGASGGGSSGSTDLVSNDESTCAPVYIQSGVKHFTDIDYVSSDEFGLNLVRYYSSIPVPVYVRSDRAGIFGTSWSSNFDERLKIKYTDGTQCGRGQRSACFANKVPDEITYRNFSADIIFKRENINSNLYYPVNPSDEFMAPYAAMAVNSNGDITFTKKDGSKSLYDLYGQLKRVTSINNIEWNYTYDSSYKLYRVTHSSGKYLQFSWNTNGTVGSIQLPNSKVINYTYTNPDSGAYTLSEIIYPESAGTIKYVTQAMPGMTTFAITEKHIDGKKWGEYTYEWNSLKRAHTVKSSGYVDGVEKSTFQYEANATHVTNAKGATSTYQFDQNNRLTQIINPQSASCPILANHYLYEGNTKRVELKKLQDGSEQIQKYLPNGLVQWSYHKGLRTEYTYGTYLQVATETVYEDRRGYDATCGSGVDCSTSPRTLPIRSSEYQYDPNHRRLTSVKERSLKTDGAYTDWRTTTYRYDLHPNKLVKSMFAAGHKLGTTAEVEYRYNTSGDLTNIIYPNGYSENFSFTNGMLQRQSDTNGIYQDYLYDGMGRVKNVKTNNDPNLSTNYTYYIDGILKNTGFSNGFAKSFELDNGRRVSRASYSLDANTPQQINYQYDLLNNLQKASLSSYAQVACQGGSGICNQMQESLVLVNQTYDTNGLLHKAYSGLASSTYDYFRPGLTKTITDGNGKNKSFTYDSWGNIKTDKNELSQTSYYKYNPAGQLNEVTDANGVKTKYFWNGFNELERIESTDAGITSTQYDVLGNINSITNALGIRVDYSYDNLSRIKQQRAPSTSDSIDYYYDSNAPGATISCLNGSGRLCGVTGNNFASYYSYTALGLLNTQIDSIHGTNYSRSYGYNQYGQLSQITYPNGTPVKYEYYLDGTQKNVQVYISGAWRLIATFQKNFDNNAIVYSGGDTQKRFFNKDGRTTSITSTLLAKSYAYKPNTNLISGISTTNYTAANLSLSYDDAGRLTTSNLDGVFTYDGNGNRLTALLAGTSSSAPYVYTTGTNKLTTANAIPSSNTKSYVYDAAGNAKEQNGAGIRRFAYDGFGRMTSVSGNIPTHQYTYNHLNQRIYKNNTSAPPQYNFRYLYNQDGQIEFEASTTVPSGRIYIYLNGLLVSLVDGNSIYHVQTDHLARPEIVAEGNTIKWRAVNTAFGRNIATTGFTLNSGFPGQYFDSETGLWYNWHRYYDASIGRYIQSDPIGLRGGLNTFAYAENNPISNIDPMGLCIWDACVVEGYVVGQLIVGGIALGVAAYSLYDRPHLPHSDINMYAKGGKQNISDSGLAGYSDEEISAGARDRSKSGEERRRFQKEEKSRKDRNRKKREEQCNK